VPGDKPGSYQTAAIDEPIVGDDGDSRISVGDFAPPPSTPSKTAPSFANVHSRVVTSSQYDVRAWSLLIPYTPNQAGAGTARQRRSINRALDLAATRRDRPFPSHSIITPHMTN
jgi:hypothetical protein